ncbi:copper chaperone PCu(A)C [Thermaurantiacus sp.]
MSARFASRLAWPRLLGLAACVTSGALLALALAGGSASVIPARAQGSMSPKVTGAWVRLPAVAGRPAAAYLEVAASPGDALVGAKSPQAGRIEMHTMTNADGVMRMRAEPRFEVPGSGRLSFAPGGAHLMLFDLAASVKPGDRVPIELSFASGAKVMVSAEARAAGASHQH